MPGQARRLRYSRPLAQGTEDVYRARNTRRGWAAGKLGWPAQFDAAQTTEVTRLIADGSSRSLLACPSHQSGSTQFQDVSMAHSDFDLKALYDALDEQRRSREMSWAAVTREVNRFLTVARPIATSTITGLKNKDVGEGDGILQMLLWLRRTPESFVPGSPEADAERFRLPELRKGQILRWNTKALHSALNAQRQARGMTWKEVAQQIDGFTPGMLTNLANGGRTGFPHVMRIVRWLGQPAVIFTRVAAW